MRIGFIGFLLLHILMSIYSGAMAGGDGFVVTTLTQAMSSTDNHAHVTSTGGYLTEHGIVVIGDEECYYDSSNATQFITLTRGYEQTTAASHASGTNVYTEDASAFAYAIGYDLTRTVDSAGVFSLVVIPFNTLAITIPRIAMFNYQFLEGDNAWIAYIYYASIMGMILTLALSYATSRPSVGIG
jgi:hypothetical protein